MNVYEFFKFPTLGIISQFGNTLWAMYLHYIWQKNKQAVGANKQFLLTIKIDWTKISFGNLTSLGYSYK